MKNFLLVIFITLLINPLIAQNQLTGDVRSWTREDFIGFDPVGDCQLETGDISSVYIKKMKDQFLLRISFDDMAERHSEVVFFNRFDNNDIVISFKLIAPGSDLPLLSKTISLNGKAGSADNCEYLLTPESNLFECSVNESVLNTENFPIFIRVRVNGETADTFEGDTKGTQDMGNCAFVHHGNQGLTYTDVFYGNAFGQSGIDGSGYDEVLDVHRATGIPGNFHMSGTLMPAAAWHNPEFNDTLAAMASRGLVSMMTSALGQNIMPFATDEMNNWSVYVESQMVQYRYNYTPHVAWVPERVWLAQGYYPDAGVIDWLGDNWTQHGVWGVVLDDWPHLNGYDNRKIHWMNNGSGVSLRVIPIDNTFVGNMHYDADAAKNHIASMGHYNICVYGTDWEVAAEMNEHDGTFFLDNYESVLWYCHDNYPGVNVWKLEDAITNPDFNGQGADITKGTYGLLGGTDGYGGSNNSWYINWASTPSHSDFHDPKWNYGYIWSNAFDFLNSVADNNLSQLAWYTLMINLHETGWHTSGEVADWEHRYSSHIKNANVFTEASRWADGQYAETTACYFEDIDRDGVDELVMHNDKVFMVFESIGGKANWVFYKNGFGDAYAVVSSDMAYWAETEGDYNESSNNHVAALSDVSPNQQNSIYNIVINNSSGDTVKATLDQWGVKKTLTLYSGVDYLDVEYEFFDQTGYVKSGWSPDLLDLIWSGKSHLQRMWGDYGSYCGYRNESSGATAALILGNGGASHNTEFEGTLVKGDEIKGYDQFKVKLFAGYTSPPSGTSVPELNSLAAINLDVFPPELNTVASLVSNSQVLLSFSEAVDQVTAENISNYTFQGFFGNYTVTGAIRQSNWNNVILSIAETFVPSDIGEIVVSNVEDLNGNPIDQANIASLEIPTGITPHTILVDDNGINDFISASELMASSPHSLYFTWDNNNFYMGFYSLALNGSGDLFLNIDTDQTPGSGAETGSWSRVTFAGDYLPEYQIAIEGGGGSMQVNNWDGTNWNYPGNGVIGSSYEGWTGNGLTEISIPWSALGNPSGIAVSVHVSQEDNVIVPTVFPAINPTGSQPEISYFYAFFIPFIGGNMPMEGMAPNAAYVVPNTSPQIISSIPYDALVEINAGSSQNFSLTAQDQEGDPLYYSWKLDGTEVGSNNNFLYQTQEADVGSHLLQAIVSDNVPGNNADTAVWEIDVMPVGFRLKLKVFLEGPFGDTAMQTGLNASGLIPLVQPYSVVPWNYPGTEEVLEIPGINVVDWILIETRDANIPEEATSAAVTSRQAAFLMRDGSVRSFSGDSVLNFNTSINQNLFVVIYHRDHLAIMSSEGLTATEGIYQYDFTTSVSKVFGGTAGYKQLNSDTWGMVGGDANNDGIITIDDKTSGWQSQVGQTGYISADFTLDTQVNNLDKNEIWLPNSGAGSQIPAKVQSAYSSQVPK